MPLEQAKALQRISLSIQRIAKFGDAHTQNRDALRTLTLISEELMSESELDGRPPRKEFVDAFSLTPSKSPESETRRDFGLDIAIRNWFEAARYVQVMLHLTVAELKSAKREQEVVARTWLITSALPYIQKELTGKAVKAGYKDKEEHHYGAEFIIEALVAMGLAPTNSQAFTRARSRARAKIQPND